jgi:hypothetical protein
MAPNDSSSPKSFYENLLGSVLQTFPHRMSDFRYAWTYSTCVPHLQLVSFLLTTFLCPSNHHEKLNPPDHPPKDHRLKWPPMHLASTSRLNELLSSTKVTTNSWWICKVENSTNYGLLKVTPWLLTHFMPTLPMKALATWQTALFRRDSLFMKLKYLT